MEINWMDITNLGFPILFGVFVLYTANKWGPKLLDTFMSFSKAIYELNKSVEYNTTVTQRQYEESMSVREQLKRLNEKLNARDARFDKQSLEHEHFIKITQEERDETRELLREIIVKVNRLMEDR
jgi:hypothetical protein